MNRVAVAACALGIVCVTNASATEPTDDVFRRGAAALAAGAYGDAIDQFELLADRGFEHPDASFDRGLAYVARVRSGNERPGDLGRAAAAFEETLRLRSGDADADRALDLVRAAVTRRRARRGSDAVNVRPTLDRVVVGSAPEWVWAALAAACSALVALGLVLRRRPTGPAHVAGSILVPVALVGMAAFVPLTLGARWLAANTRAAVVVAPDVKLEGDDGRPIGQGTVPEAALVEVAGARAARRIRVRWGSLEGWIPADSVRLLPP